MGIDRNNVVTSVCTGDSRCPPDICIEMGSIPQHLNADTIEKGYPNG
ncbi:MAG: hypothetical protein IKY18_08555 [Oscillospiraceae bacterium]|nr:hypothetical protein [Oscillospiraceae bacterium]